MSDSFYIDRVRDFCGAGIALTSAFNVLQDPTIVISHAIDVGVAFGGAVAGIFMLDNAAREIIKRIHQTNTSKLER